MAEPAKASEPAAPLLLSARQLYASRTVLIFGEVSTRLNRIFAAATGQPYDKVLRDTDRNHWLSAEEAVAYGLVSRVVEKAFDTF